MNETQRSLYRRSWRVRTQETYACTIVIFLRQHGMASRRDIPFVAVVCTRRLTRSKGNSSSVQPDFFLTTHVDDIHDSGGEVDGALPVSGAVGVAQGPVAGSGRGQKMGRARRRRGEKSERRKYRLGSHVNILQDVFRVSRCVFTYTRKYQCKKVHLAHTALLDRPPCLLCVRQSGARHVVLSQDRRTAQHTACMTGLNGTFHHG